LGREPMKLRYIAFKWHVDAPIAAVTPVLEQLRLRSVKKHIWTRSVGDHTLQVEFRERMSSHERSYYWIRFAHASALTDKGALDRVLADWFFTMSRHFNTYVNWMQVALDIDEFRPLYGYTESSPRIWSKTEKHQRFSLFPYLDHYLFEVKNEDIRKSIPHQRFSNWLDDLKHNLLGHERPDDQIRFDLVV
jgi:hypothetical protein